MDTDFYSDFVAIVLLCGCGEVYTCVNSRVERTKDKIQGTVSVSFWKDTWWKTLSKTRPKYSRALVLTISFMKQYFIITCYAITHDQVLDHSVLKHNQNYALNRHRQTNVCPILFVVKALAR